MSPELEAALDNLERLLAHEQRNNVFRLPGSLARLLALLLSAPVVDAELVNSALKLKSDAKITVQRLRAHLAPYGVVVRSARSAGYFLEDAMKQRVRDFITYGVTLAESGDFAPAYAEDATLTVEAPIATLEPQDDQHDGQDRKDSTPPGEPATSRAA